MTGFKRKVAGYQLEVCWYDDVIFNYDVICLSSLFGVFILVV